MNYKKTIKEFEKRYDEKSVRLLRDLKNEFLDITGVDENETVYEVFIKNYSPVNLGLTVLNSGSVNKEYYFTKGHIHRAKTPEFYILLEGSGILLLKKKGKRAKSIILKKGKIELIGEGYAHRLINNGKRKLKVLTIYHEDSKPDYKIKFGRRFFRK